MPSPLRAALLALLGRRPTLVQRRSLIAELRALADEQEQLADAEERNGVRVRAIQARDAANAAPRPKGGRPKGSGGRFVRIEAPATRSAVVHIAPALLQELGDPTHVTLERRVGRLEIRAALAPDPQPHLVERHGRELVKPRAAVHTSYVISRPTGPRSGNPRISVGRTIARRLDLQAGKFAAHIDAGAIVVGAALRIENRNTPRSLE